MKCYRCGDMGVVLQSVQYNGKCHKTCQDCADNMALSLPRSRVFHSVSQSRESFGMSFRESRQAIRRLPKGRNSQKLLCETQSQ